MPNVDQRMEVTPPTRPRRTSKVILDHKIWFYFLACKKTASYTELSSYSRSIYELDESTLYVKSFAELKSVSRETRDIFIHGKLK